MEAINTTIKKKEYISLDLQIRAAEERKGRGEPGANEQLRQFQRQRDRKGVEIETAQKKDYWENLRLRRQHRTPREKVRDFLSCER